MGSLLQGFDANYNPQGAVDAYNQGPLNALKLRQAMADHEANALKSKYAELEMPNKIMELRLKNAKAMAPFNKERVDAYAGNEGSDALSELNAMSSQYFNEEAPNIELPSTPSLDEFLKKYPDATPEQVAEEYKKIKQVGTQSKPAAKPAAPAKQAPKAKTLPLKVAPPKTGYAPALNDELLAFAAGDARGLVKPGGQAQFTLDELKASMAGAPKAGGSRMPQSVEEAAVMDVQEQPVDTVEARVPANSGFKVTEQDMMQYLNQLPIESLMSEAEEKILPQAMALQAAQAKTAATGMKELSAKKQEQLIEAEKIQAQLKQKMIEASSQQEYNVWKTRYEEHTKRLDVARKIIDPYKQGWAPPRSGNRTDPVLAALLAEKKAFAGQLTKIPTWNKAARSELAAGMYEQLKLRLPTEAEGFYRQYKPLIDNGLQKRGQSIPNAAQAESKYEVDKEYKDKNGVTYIYQGNGKMKKKN